MKSTVILRIVTLVLLALILGFSLFRTFGPASAVSTQLDQTLTEDEKQDINTDILNDQTIKSLDSRKVFGARPVGNTDSLNRPNPFEGI